MRRKLIVGNWKMNGSLATNAVLLSEIRAGLDGGNCDVSVCVAAPYLPQCREALEGASIHVGGQDVSVHVSGAHTGEVSAAMLADLGCRHVIIGHSERRADHGETDAIVAAKALQALASGLVPIICVGETSEEREAGRTNLVVSRQVDAVLDRCSLEDLTRIVIAYEPVWAIGTGKTATPQMAQDIHALIRSRLAARSQAAADSVSILYGGSMKPDNAAQLLAMADIDGGLIGGASLKSADFLAIIRAA